MSADFFTAHLIGFMCSFLQWKDNIVLIHLLPGNYYFSVLYAPDCFHDYKVVLLN
ncbi:Uncharacterised protein [Mycobacteroides abscessus subsp. abscessus]|nr:Uncharacterised protein [Mycobacteroides abscessus subsp. abscessus]